MKTMYKTTRVIAGLAFGILMLFGCTTPTVVVPPTQDISIIRTEVAQTVVAKLTIAAALNPTATEAPAQAQPEPIVITATLAPSATPLAETAAQAPAVVSQASTATTAPTQRPAAISGGGVYPTRTVRALPDNLSYLSSTPADLAKFKAGTNFDAVWKVKNTGSTTWKPEYYLRFARGTDMGDAPRFYLNKSVKPGETVNLIADIVAPPAAGTYVGYYEFCTDNADIIYTVYVAIVVPE
jgi:hypothetical protein